MSWNVRTRRKLSPRVQRPQSEAAVLLVGRLDDPQGVPRGPGLDRRAAERARRAAAPPHRPRAVRQPGNRPARPGRPRRPRRPPTARTRPAARALPQEAQESRCGRYPATASSLSWNARPSGSSAGSPSRPPSVQHVQEPRQPGERAAGSAPARRTAWSTASAPISPTASRCGSSRGRRRAACTMSAPETVCSSPRPSCSISAAWVSGSSRAPNRDAVLRTPLAIAFTRPRSAV